MRISPRFIKVAALCALLSVLTTLVVHVVPGLWADADTFEKQLELRNRFLYVSGLWIVFVQCILIIISMYAIALLRFRDTPALAGLGFVCFFVFSFTQMLGTSLRIFVLNRTWRAGYAAATDEATRAWLRAAIDTYAGVSDALFLVFFLAGLFGLLCYGLSLTNAGGIDRKMGLLFFVWIALAIPAHIDTVTGVQSISRYFEWVGPYFLPIARGTIGVWLWKKSNELPSGSVA